MYLIDPPPPYASKKELKDFIAEMKGLDDDPEVRRAIREAEKLLQGK